MSELEKLKASSFGKRKRKRVLLGTPPVKKAVISAGDGQSEVSLSQSSVPPSDTVLAGSSSSSLGLVTSYAPTGTVVTFNTVLAGSSSSSSIGY